MNKDAIVIIIGAGQLGYRYLQGLIPLLDSIKVYVVDFSEISLRKAEKMLKQNTLLNLENVIYLNDFRKIDIKNPDLVIISSTSKGRAKLIIEVERFMGPKYWVIEKVLEQSLVELEKIRLLSSSLKGKAWVNNPRRIMSWHINLKDQIKKLRSREGNLDFEYIGINWGMGCNAIHLIDLVTWWMDEIPCRNISCNIDEWLPAKRKGYYEPFGKLKFEFSKGSTLNLICNKGVDNFEDRFIEIFYRNLSLLKIEECLGKADFKNQKIINGKLELQSEMTSGLVQQILIKGNCGLTPLRMSIIEHEILIKTLSKSWEKNEKFQSAIGFVPIT